jgi:hypothetical protein
MDYEPLEVATFTTQLIGGVADGIRLVRFMGRTMVTLVVPRQRVKEAKGLPDIPPRGVYYLLRMENGAPERLYAGQTVQGVTRLESHLSSKAWWDVAVMFLASDSSFTKDVIDGLEAMMIRYAQQYAFCQVDNGNNPKPHVSPYYEGLVLDMHEELLWRMDVLGYRFSTETGLKPEFDERPNARKKNPPFNFEEFGIANGAQLVFFDARAGTARPDITATVCGPRKIRYKGKVTSISAVAKRVMKFKSNPRGPEYWTYNGRLLVDIYRDRYPI